MGAAIEGWPMRERDVREETEGERPWGRRRKRGRCREGVVGLHAVLHTFVIAR